MVVFPIHLRQKMVLQNAQLVIRLIHLDEQLNHVSSPNHQMLKFEKFLCDEALDHLAPQAACGFCKGCFTERYPVETPQA